MAETFEAYVHDGDFTLDATTQKSLESVTGHRFLAAMLYGVIKHQDVAEPKDLYYVLHRSAISVYHFARAQGKLPLEVSILVHGMYELDSHCGISETLEPEQSVEEHQRILGLLDADLIKFRDTYLRTLHKLSSLELTSYYREFARLLFAFNGYQAPPRLSTEQAMRDAAGLTDLFWELIVARE